MSVVCLQVVQRSYSFSTSVYSFANWELFLTIRSFRSVRLVACKQNGIRIICGKLMMLYEYILLNFTNLIATFLLMHACSSRNIVKYPRAAVVGRLDSVCVMRENKTRPSRNRSWRSTASRRGRHWVSLAIGESDESGFATSPPSPEILQRIANLSIGKVLTASTEQR